MSKVLEPPPLASLEAELAKDVYSFVRVFDLVRSSKGLVNGKYHHWDTIFHMEPPTGYSHREWWLALKIARSAQGRVVPLRSTTGRPFSFNLVDPVIERLHKIDQFASGNIQISDKVTNPSTRDRYVINSLIEEAIRSSQLEGASTTRKVAKEMLRTGRRPRDRSEQMIFNNYRAMQWVRELRGERLTPELVCELHRIVTERTLDDADEAGRIQTRDDVRVKIYDVNDVVLHTPPPAEELAERLRAMCDFANNVARSEVFVHPVVRAIILHFWLAYDHPFGDGNGRTARALFYWSMLSQGYWLTEFLTISAILKQAPAKYATAFLYTETDGEDLTYFLVYQLDVILRAIKELHEYLERKIAEVREAERLAKANGNLNHRQLALIGHAMRNSDAEYTIRSHQKSHGVVYQTARSDLFALVRMGLLEVARRGRADYFTPPRDLSDRLTATS